MYKLLLLCLAVVCFAHAYHKHEDKKPVTVPASSTTPATQAGEADPVTVTPSGSIRGSWMRTRRGRPFQAYRGIRYAEPPVGPLRFQPPKPIVQYAGEVDASEEGPACPLPAPPAYFVDEDCLTVNVYTPFTNSSKPLPVFFYIHPGGFYSMTGRSDVAGPHYLLDRDIVLVTVNYRIGSLGFISTGDALAPGNNGMKDQVVALRWVQKNIRAFGGDPGLVTVAGTSAGSISVMLHMISPMTKGLFHRGISMSASPISKEPNPTHLKELAVQQAQILNCPTDSSKAIIDCLKTKTWREMGDSLLKFFTFGPGDPLSLWKPVVEQDFGQERYLHMQPADAIRQGKMHAVPHIISQTEDEFYWKAFSILKNETLRKRMDAEWDQIAPLSFSLPKGNLETSVPRLREFYFQNKPLLDDKPTADGLGKLYSDTLIGFSVYRMAKMMCKYSPHPVYFYEFSYFGNNSFYEDPNTGKPIGAMHHDDMLYFLTLSFRFPTIGVDSPHSHMVDKMTAFFYNFARYGDPNPREDTPELAGVSWPQMKTDARKYLRIADKLEVRENLFEDRYKVWEELYPMQY